GLAGPHRPGRRDKRAPGAVPAAPGTAGPRRARAAAQRRRHRRDGPPGPPDALRTALTGTTTPPGAAAGATRNRMRLSAARNGPRLGIEPVQRLQSAWPQEPLGGAGSFLGRRTPCRRGAVPVAPRPWGNGDAPCTRP